MAKVSERFAAEKFEKFKFQLTGVRRQIRDDRIKTPTDVQSRIRQAVVVFITRGKEED